MHWIPLNHNSQLETIAEKSYLQPQVIFKHSTRCSISSMALNRLEKSTAPVGVDYYYLDLLAYRVVSDAIADKWKIEHESPQVLIIRNGDCVFDTSHNGISMQVISTQLER
ncbi:MAG TPA: bacillithiol system redox-active protein YtxJ [Ferruginibacter sp.]|nr:bacillithiol system redox-active protein YtxJ [Ferruginibacter sp.]HRO16554.1 bacillithiol system redox-active protein YtxJ [Ferruginibacter sp.]HRQ19937.1 bacillithiol system redox-active protein YtxJ [Ferruginibacter sp.]